MSKIHCDLIFESLALSPYKGNLYLGGFKSLDEQHFKNFKIDHVLTIMDEYVYEAVKIPEKIQKLKIVEHKWINLQDSEQQNIGQHFDQTLQWIENCLNNGNLLVHCFAGISRSATMVIAYIMKSMEYSLEKANKFVVSKRVIVQPNLGFWSHLQEYQKRIFQRQMQNLKVQAQIKQMKQNGVIFDYQSIFSSQKYPSKYANHIICINKQSPSDHGNLFLGQVTILRPQFIQSLKIKSIISVIEQQYSKRIKIVQKIQHFKIQNYLWLDILDKPESNLGKYFKQTFEFIDKNLKEGNVLVHCQAGVSRSASIVIAYIIQKFNTSYYDALNFVKKKRNVVRPNAGFEKSLIYYSKINQKTTKQQSELQN